MEYAITPRGVGKPVDARAIPDGAPLENGETFRLPEGTIFDRKVLAGDGFSLRPQTPADRKKDREDFVDQLLSINEDSHIALRVLDILIKDIAPLKSMTPINYLRDIIRRLT